MRHGVCREGSAGELRKEAHKKVRAAFWRWLAPGGGRREGGDGRPAGAEAAEAGAAGRRADGRGQCGGWQSADRYHRCDNCVGRMVGSKHQRQQSASHNSTACLTPHPHLVAC